MNLNCLRCHAPFEFTAADEALLKKIAPVYAGTQLSIPAPTHCPACRMQRRLAYHNEHRLYRRTCAASGKSLISMYPPEADLVVYDFQIWWGETWDPLSYGREFDFNRSFAENFADLRREVPRMSVLQSMTENSIYTCYVSYLKDCYLLFTSDYNRDCSYGIWVENSRDCYNNCIIDNCELSYGGLFSNQLYNTAFVVRSAQCHDSAFLFDCRGCSNCFMCHGLRNKEYCLNNVQYSKAEYFTLRSQFALHSGAVIERCKQLFADLVDSAAHLYMWRNGRVLDSSGDFLTDVENCIECYETIRSKDCKYCLGVEIKDSLDCTYANAELGYEMCECFPLPYRSAFNVNSYTGRHLFYCDHCMNDCADCFGCIGLKHAQYCIFNRQYSKAEYERLVVKIVEHMRQTGEWGEFFSMAQSVFPYNESLAQDHFPLNKPAARKEGLWWRDADAKEYLPPEMELPDDLRETDSAITKAALACTACRKNYRITARELEFHRRQDLALPRICFDCRLAEWRQFRNPRRLEPRSCTMCGQNLLSTYAQSRPETVLCEACYHRTVY